MLIFLDDNKEKHANEIGIQVLASKKIAI